MDVDLSQDGSSSQSDNQEIETGDAAPATRDVGSAPGTNPITELEKLEKFRFEGQEFTPKDLKAAILRMKDYTQKTQEHSKAVESFNQERKFYDNLYADLQLVRDNPKLAAEFVKVYPEKFHGALKQVLSQTNGQGSSQQTAQSGSQTDVELLSRLAKLENADRERQVTANKQMIETKIEALSKQYPKAIPRLAIADVFEAYNQTGEMPSDEVWAAAFKASEELRRQLTKEDYAELQKKQSAANQKARDVDSGGGTPGRAPKKFGSLKEVTEYAANSIESNRG